ncbi:hypothetical protein JW968_03245 [Candidatus Woesearchaeota archaeon]|nr:hypothetical protein [Candidatus Woesearchaeota archaeon]
MEQIELKEKGVEDISFEDNQKQIIYNLANETKLLITRNSDLEREVNALKDALIEKKRFIENEVVKAREMIELRIRERIAHYDKVLNEREGKYRKSLAELENTYLEREAELKLELESEREALKAREEHHLRRLREIQDELEAIRETDTRITDELKAENSELKNRLIEQKRVMFEKQHRIREVLLKIKNHFNELSELGNVFDDLKVRFNDDEIAYLIRIDLEKGMDYREIIDYYQMFGYGSEYIMGIINKNSGFLG